MDTPAQSQSLASSDIAQLQSQLASGSEKAQLQVISELWAMGLPGQQTLQSFLLKRYQDERQPSFVDGRCYELLLKSDCPEVQTFVQTHFPTGIIPLHSERGIDYQPLQKQLRQQQFQEADRLTMEKLCELAGPAALKRKWIYFTEVEALPIADLKTIDQLWSVHSEGKFAYSVQRQLWLSVDKNWDALWPKINWKSGKTWTRYPDGFIWDLSAPRGHLPLSNQLRGVQVINALLSHPAWSS